MSQVHRFKMCQKNFIEMKKSPQIYMIHDNYGLNAITSTTL